MARGDEATARACRAEAEAAVRGEFGGRRGAARGSRDRVRRGQAAGCWLQIGRDLPAGSAFGLRRSGSIRRAARHAGNGNALVEFRASRVPVAAWGRWCRAGDLACCALRLLVSACVVGASPVGCWASALPWTRVGCAGWAARSSRPYRCTLLIWAEFVFDKPWYRKQNTSSTSPINLKATAIFRG